MMTLPDAFGIAIENDAAIHPTAGTSAPATDRAARPHSRQAAPIATAKQTAATGTGPMPRLNWNEPVSPSSTPNISSTAYRTATARTCWGGKVHNVDGVPGCPGVVPGCPDAGGNVSFAAPDVPAAGRAGGGAFR